MRLVYLFLLIIVITASEADAQTVLQQEPSRELELTAQETAEMWQRKLAMSTKQTALVKINLIEFALKREELLQMDLPKEEKTRRLIALEVLENKDLRDILTKPQFDMYLSIKEEKMEDKNERPER